MEIKFLEILEKEGYHLVEPFNPEIELFLACKERHPFFSTAADFIAGNRCPQCSEQPEHVEDEDITLKPDKYKSHQQRVITMSVDTKKEDELLHLLGLLDFKLVSPYQSVIESVTFECNRGHRFITTPNNFKSKSTGTGCPECNKELVLVKLLSTNKLKSISRRIYKKNKLIDKHGWSSVGDLHRSHLEKLLERREEIRKKIPFDASKYAHLDGDKFNKAINLLEVDKPKQEPKISAKQLLINKGFKILQKIGLKHLIECPKGHRNEVIISTLRYQCCKECNFKERSTERFKDALKSTDIKKVRTFKESSQAALRRSTKDEDIKLYNERIALIKNRIKELKSKGYS